LDFLTGEARRGVDRHRELKLLRASSDCGVVYCCPDAHETPRLRTALGSSRAGRQCRPPCPDSCLDQFEGFVKVTCGSASITAARLCRRACFWPGGGAQNREHRHPAKDLLRCIGFYHNDELQVRNRMSEVKICNARSSRREYRSPLDGNAVAPP